MLQTESAAIGTVIENRAIVELPLNGRNYLQLASLTPGATTNGPSSSQGRQRMGGQRNSFALNVGGQRVHYNHYSLDGVENTDLNFNSYMLLPSVDALQEFKVEAGLFDAEYGRAIAQINASTKAGTNQFHGSVFQFVRDSALDAKNYFDPADRPIPPFTRKQYGVTAGGPVVIPKLVDGRNKLFFMFNWEGLRERKSLTASPSLPLSAWRNGDFSQLRDAGGNLIPIYDPATRVFDAAGNVIAGARRRSPATSFRRTVSIRSRKACWRSIRCRSRSGRARISPITRRGAPMPTSSRTASTSSKARSRTGSSGTASRTSSATTRSRFPNMGINTDTDVHQAVLANTRVLGSNKFNDLRIGYGKLDNAHISPRANTVNVVEELGHQHSLRQSSVLGRAQHRHHGAVRPGRGERRAVHQPRHDDSGRRQFLLERRRARVQVRRRAAPRAVRPDRRRGDARTLGVRRALHAEPAPAGREPRRRRVCRLPAGPLQPIRRTGGRADRQLPLGLLRAVRAGQLESAADAHDQLRAALGVRPALLRQERQHRQHRLQVGQLGGTGVRARGNRRSLRGQSRVPAGA